jgi:hypothetical protein
VNTILDGKDNKMETSNICLKSLDEAEYELSWESEQLMRELAEMTAGDHSAVETIPEPVRTYKYELERTVENKIMQQGIFGDVTSITLENDIWHIRVRLFWSPYVDLEDENVPMYYTMTGTTPQIMYHVNHIIHSFKFGPTDKVNWREEGF